MDTLLAVKERAILMSAPMALATLEDRKGQTRRLNSLDRFNVEPDSWTLIHCGFLEESKKTFVAVFGHANGGAITVRCPYGKPGDRLWVRETWRTRKCFDNLSPNDIGKRVGKDVFYEADSALLDISGVREEFTPGRIRSSIHLPRWGSRITLEITGVRVERLREISEADAKAEGVQPWFEADLQPDGELREGPSQAYRAGFMEIWSSINGQDSWDLNPFVWVISFKRLPQ